METIEEKDGVIIVKNPIEPIYGEGAFNLEEEYIFSISLVVDKLTRIQFDLGLIFPVLFRRDFESNFSLKTTSLFLLSKLDHSKCQHQRFLRRGSDRLFPIPTSAWRLHIHKFQSP